MEKEDIGNQIDSIRRLLDDLKNVGDWVPKLQQTLELTEYKYQLIESMPKDLPQQYADSLKETLTNDIEFWKNNLPTVSYGPAGIPISGLSWTLSGATGSVSILSEIEGRYQDKYNGWTTPLINQYAEIQDKQNRRKYISDFLKILAPDIHQHFEQSYIAFEKIKSDNTSQFEWAIICRNIFESLKGRLFDKARAVGPWISTSKKLLKWTNMCKNLAIGGEGSTDYDLLLNEFIEHETLHTEFTLSAKNKFLETDSTIMARFTRYIDHLFTVLNALERTKLT